MERIKEELLAFLKEKHGDGFVNRLKYYFNLYFGTLHLENRRVLEIGAGNGYMSALCLAHGASRVIALDPESAGSTQGINKQFTLLKESVSMGNGIEYLPVSLEEFISTRGEETFDFILMCNVINHIDENAVSKLHLPDAERERKVYRETFIKLYHLLTPEGTLVLSDAGRYNFWNFVGLCFPTCRSINWDIHQNPDVWASLLSQAGFAAMDVRWVALYCLRYFKAVVCRKWAAQCLNSYFIIQAEKRGGISG